jgi:hydrophobic/amphiphilic exporter-1 (mainly G- bacteria), HAE1 family
MFSRFFIDRPIFATVVSIITVIAGLVTMKALPLAQFPNIVPPTVQVSTTYPGANAKVLSETVAQPIEEQVNGVEGMLYMNSVCSNSGEYNLLVTFEVGTNTDMAQVLVQNRVAVAEPLLPEEVRRQGVITKRRTASFLLIVGLSSPDGRYDMLYLSNYGTLRIVDELARIDGVGDVFVFGSGRYSMRIWLEPDKLKVRGLTTAEVIAAIKEQNVQVAAGQIGQAPTPEGQNFQYTINTLGRLEDVAQFEDIVLKTGEGGRLTRLKDVARIELGSQSYDVSSASRGKPCANIAIAQLPGANALDVAEKVQAKMEEISKTFPEGLTYSIPLDTTKFVDAAIEEVVQTLFIACLLVCLVILIFLEDWRATLIPAATIPVCLIGTFAVMALFGVSINMLSLFGIVLAIGIVVDDAIVVVENTIRNMDEVKLPPREATIQAMTEVTGPIVATTLVLLAVFIPAAFLGGITGQLYRQFALTIATATVFSALNALTLSPALCVIFLRPEQGQRNAFTRAFNWAFGKTRTVYQGTLQSLVRRGGLMLLLFALLTGAALWGFVRLPTGFLPTEDQGYAFVIVQLPDAASRNRTAEVMEEINTRLEATPGIKSWVSVTGLSIIDFATVSNMAFCWVVYEPWDKRKSPELSQQAIVQGLWKRFGDIEDALIFPVVPPAITGLGHVGGFQMELQDRGSLGSATLQDIANELVANANAQPGLVGCFSTFRASAPQLFVDVNRTQAKQLDVPLSQIFDTLQAYLGTVYVNDFNKFGRTYQVRAQADTRFRADLNDIRRLEVRNRLGEMVPLGAVVHIEETLGPQILTRYNMYPSAAIHGAAAPGSSSGDAMKLMEATAAATLPRAMGYEWTAMSYQEKVSGNQAPYIFALAVLFVYLVLCAQYESWSIPISIIMSVPLALLGMVIAVTMRGMDNNVYSQIGIVLLIALASKTSILLVEFAKVKHEAGLTIEAASLEAARIRFRPILMTALTLIFGVSPLVIASGAGAASRQALGTAVVGGMISATVLLVVFVPVFYVVIQRLSERFWRR